MSLTLSISVSFDICNVDCDNKLCNIYALCIYADIVQRDEDVVDLALYKCLLLSLICTNFIKRDCLSSSILKPLIPCGSIERPYCLRSGERVPVRFVSKTKRFADFCTIKYHDHL